METVGDRLAKAQASGDLNAIRSALQDAKAAGADPAEIDRAMAEVASLEASGAQPRATGGASEQVATTSAATDLRASAEAHKKRGNERLKVNTKSAAREAMECFTTGLEVRCEDAVLNAQLYSNRAHVRILLRQFVEAVDDCRKAIELDPKNVKSYWRGAKASMNLDLCKNAIEFCEGGLKQEPTNEDLMKMKSTCAEKLAGQVRRKAELTTGTSAGSQEFNADEAMALQDRVNSLNEQVQQLTHSIATKQNRRAQLNKTVEILGELPADAKTYIACGRGFLRQEKEYVDTKLDEMKDTLETEIPKLKNTLEELEKRKAASEQELREMIQAFKQLSEG